MKPLVATGLLILLLYQLIGLPLAMLTFEQSYESAAPVSSKDQWKLVKLPISLPYTTSWENADGQDGLVQEGDTFYNIVHQRYANDTLYTLLKTNENAKERFCDLAEQLEQFNNDQTPAKTPLSQLLKLLKDRLTTYLLPISYQLTPPIAMTALANTRYAQVLLAHYGVDTSPGSPPPRI